MRAAQGRRAGFRGRETQASAHCPCVPLSSITSDTTGSLALEIMPHLRCVVRIKEVCV